MDAADAPEMALEALVGEAVVIDVRGPYVYIGTLRRVARDSFVLADADVHACHDSQTTSELYVLEAKKSGVRPNRKLVYVMRSEVLSVSRIEDVVEY